jgi:thiamine-monophosphate kinase
MGEFDLIARYFKRPAHHLNPAVGLGIGDDCALLQPSPGMQLAVSTDMLVAGRHFFDDVDPHALGHKALAVNLSDLAACGAKPLAFTLALSLPQADEAWLHAFSQGLFELADAHNCSLMGGDTTRGPLNICITVLGEVPAGQALLRSGAQVGDDIYVSGHLGDARLALEVLQSQRQTDEATPIWASHVPAAVLAQARQRLERPTPRVALGLALRGIANAAMDLSDGLAGDLPHILQASGVGARMNVDTATELIAAKHHSALSHAELHAAFTPHNLQRWVLSGGDDYELLFTAAPHQHAVVHAAAAQAGVSVTRIGRIEAQAGLRWVNQAGETLPLELASFDHFKIMRAC